MKKTVILILLFFISKSSILAQTDNSAPKYPQIKAYASVVHPIVTFDKNGSTFNFSNGYSVLFPFGINLYKSSKIGFSFELAPSIRVENKVSKVNNLVFHPGVIFPLKHGFAYLTRLAFETSGRYGLTPVLSKTIVKQANSSFYMTTATPIRFGNAKPSSIGLALQFGIAF